MVLDPIPQCLPVHIFGSRPQPPTSRTRMCRSIHISSLKSRWQIVREPSVVLPFWLQSLHTVGRTWVGTEWRRGAGHFPQTSPIFDYRFVTWLNESCHTYERVMSRIWMSHVTYMNASCHTYARSHVQDLDSTFSLYGMFTGSRIDRSRLQNIVSFIRLFCKRDP